MRVGGQSTNPNSQHCKLGQMSWAWNQLEIFMAMELADGGESKWKGSDDDYEAGEWHYGVLAKHLKSLSYTHHIHHRASCPVYF